MGTTLLFAELIVGGVQTLVWLFILATVWWPPERLLGPIRPLSAAEGVLLIILAYTMGVVFDRVWDWALKPVSQRLKAAILKRPARADKIRAQLFSTNAPQIVFVEYIRSRLRVIRATFCNSVMAAAISALVFAFRDPNRWTSVLPVISGAAAVFAILAAFAYRDITLTYYKTLIRFEEAKKQ